MRTGPNIAVAADRVAGRICPTLRSVRTLRRYPAYGRGAGHRIATGPVGDTPHGWPLARWRRKLIAGRNESAVSAPVTGLIVAPCRRRASRTRSVRRTADNVAAEARAVALEGDVEARIAQAVGASQQHIALAVSAAMSDRKTRSPGQSTLVHGRSCADPCPRAGGLRTPHLTPQHRRCWRR